MINNLLGKNTNKTTNVSEISINDMIISDYKLIAESFNDYFINIRPKLAAESNNDPNDDDPITDECARWPFGYTL